MVEASHKKGLLLDGDGFTIVTRKGKGMNRRKIASKTNTPIVKTRLDALEEPSLTLSAINLFRTRLHKLKDRLKTTQLYQFLLDNLPKFQTIVCYGLGNLTIKRCRIQLALLCLIAESFSSIKTVWSYDPSHTVQDEIFLQDCGISIISENEQGRRVIRDSEYRILFFMPHCDRWLYNNVIDYQTQQQNLANITILGNSFIEYTRRFPQEKDSIYESLRILNERKVPISITGEDSEFDPHAMFEAFNDLRLMTFS